MTDAPAKDTISAVFEPNLRRCAVLINGHLYENLRVKWIRDLEKDNPQTLYVVFVPCAQELGRNRMIAFDAEAAWDYRKSGRG